MYSLAFPPSLFKFPHFLPFAVRDHLPIKPPIPNSFLRVFQGNPDQNTTCELVSPSNRFPPWKKDGSKEGVTLNWGRQRVHDLKHKCHPLLKCSWKQFLTRVERLDGQEILRKKRLPVLNSFVKMTSTAKPRHCYLLLLLKTVLRKGARNEWLDEYISSLGGTQSGTQLGLQVPSDCFRIFFFYSWVYAQGM